MPTHRCFGLLSIGSRIMLLAVAASLVFLSTSAVSQTESVIYSFASSNNPGGPRSGLIFDKAGNLYGTTFWDGSTGLGTVFELTPSSGGGWSEKTLYNFTNGAGGYQPSGSLVFDDAGNLYGTATAGGGAHDAGTVFKLIPQSDGSWTQEVLHTFTGGSDGGAPYAGLIFDSKGNLYGTASNGGAAKGYGTVFEMSPKADGSWSYKVIHQFGGGPGDGAAPFAPLVLDQKGNLYGTTASGGLDNCDGDCGVVFELSSHSGGTWTEKILHQFYQGGDIDGMFPHGGLVLDSHGNLYGTAPESSVGSGVVYELAPQADGAWSETVLYVLLGGGEGSFPEASVVMDKSGNLYTTAWQAGAYTYGNVFKLTSASSGGWSLDVLYSFGPSANDGAGPYSNLIFDAAGNLYGTTIGGGANGTGAVFEITP
jgi:uncharacterized repeat protein (TIGR03803 family)